MGQTTNELITLARSVTETVNDAMVGLSRDWSVAVAPSDLRSMSMIWNWMFMVLVGWFTLLLKFSGVSYLVAAPDHIPLRIGRSGG